tara:strand:- start:239 stop:526 length:288 start_codon:yes stop_codon:yes gene_type:complete
MKKISILIWSLLTIALLSAGFGSQASANDCEDLLDDNWWKNTLNIVQESVLANKNCDKEILNKSLFVVDRVKQAKLLVKYGANVKVRNKGNGETV